MKLIFHCFTGSYASVVAAAVYLGMLPADRMPDDRELGRLPYFDQVPPRDYGDWLYMGEDAAGNEVFVLARKNLAVVTLRVLAGIARVFGIPPTDLRFIDASGRRSVLLDVGGFLSVRLGLRSLGRPLVLRAIRQDYARLSALAQGFRLAPFASDPATPQPDRTHLKIFYTCYGSAHSSILASAIHMGLLPSDHRPPPEVILALPRFDKTVAGEVGTPLYIGADERGVPVYAIGLKCGKIFLRRAISSLLRLYSIPEQNLIMVNALDYVNLITRLGGSLSRGLGWVALGRPLVALGIWQTYHDFVGMVARVKQNRDERLLAGGQEPFSVDGRARIKDNKLRRNDKRGGFRDEGRKQADTGERGPGG